MKSWKLALGVVAGCLAIGTLVLLCTKLAIPLLASRTQTYRQKILHVKVTADLRAFIMAAELTKAMQGHYPETLEELTTSTAEGQEPLIHPSAVKDPWDRDYVYQLVDGRPQVKCLGADGAEGGEGENKDYFETTKITEPASSEGTGVNVLEPREPEVERPHGSPSQTEMTAQGE